MSYSWFVNEYLGHPKLLKAGPLGEIIHHRSIVHSTRYETDGVIEEAALPSLFVGTETVLKALRSTPAAVVSALVSAGLWDLRLEGGYVVHDYLDFHKSKSERVAETEKKRVAGKLGGLQSWKVRQTKLEARAEAGAQAGGPPPVPFPIPIPSHSKDTHNDNGVCASSKRTPRRIPEPELSPGGGELLGAWVSVMRRHGRSPAIDPARDYPAAHAFLQLHPHDVIVTGLDFALQRGRGTKYMKDSGRFDLAILLKCWGELDEMRLEYERTTEACRKSQGAYEARMRPASKGELR